jgi:hypothetical protein
MPTVLAGEHPASTAITAIQAGVRLDARSDCAHQQTRLHRAASSGDVEALDALLDAGADTAIRTWDRRRSDQERRSEFVEWLLAEGTRAAQPPG